jgi:hypothetical protein
MPDYAIAQIRNVQMGQRASNVLRRLMPRWPRSKGHSSCTARTYTNGKDTGRMAR